MLTIINEEIPKEILEFIEEKSNEVPDEIKQVYTQYLIALYLWRSALLRLNKEFYGSVKNDIEKYLQNFVFPKMTLDDEIRKHKDEIKEHKRKMDGILIHDKDEVNKFTCKK